MIQNSTTVFTVPQWNINIKCQWACDCATACEPLSTQLLSIQGLHCDSDFF